MDETITSFKTDVAVIGAGHAGCEAALACARLGLDTVIFTLSADNIAFMPCNPHIGGSSKGHLVREIDALGGEMGKCTDEVFLQSRMLNRSKGPAVHSLRAQADKHAYSQRMRRTLEEQEHLSIKQTEITEILTEEEKGADGRITARRVTGVKTMTGLTYEASAVILCTGTYLKSRCLCGGSIIYTGPNGLMASTGLSASLEKAGIKLRRFKTGTPARMDGNSIDFSKMEALPGDKPVIPFSFETDPDTVQKEQALCYLTYTNEETHRIIRENIDRSPLYSGVIEGTGPRYCPSIEDKVVRFPERVRHQVFIEPEGAYTNEKYVDGMSSSMPEDVQAAMYRTVPGLENCRIVKNAYAIEYDCLCPGQLTNTLEIRTDTVIKGLFSAGQFNGSSGYEEAAAQGLYAGINAAMEILGKEPIIIDRSEGYIGVLVDDLITKENKEPYRMMTSRAEYRLLLRQDNADLRLTDKGYRAGIISEKRYRLFCEKRERIEKELDRLKNTQKGASEEILGFLTVKGSAGIRTGTSLAELLCRPELDYMSLEEIDPERPVEYTAEGMESACRELSLKYDITAGQAGRFFKDIINQAEIGCRYEGYIERERIQVEKFKREEKRLIPDDIDYDDVEHLRAEARQHLKTIRPANIGAASRIGGVNPADIAVLLVYLKSRRRD